MLIDIKEHKLLLFVGSDKQVKALLASDTGIEFSGETVEACLDAAKDFLGTHEITQPIIESLDDIVLQSSVFSLSYPVDKIKGRLTVRTAAKSFCYQQLFLENQADLPAKHKVRGFNELQKSVAEQAEAFLKYQADLQVQRRVAQRAIEMTKRDQQQREQQLREWRANNRAN